MLSNFKNFKKLQNLKNASNFRQFPFTYIIKPLWISFYIIIKFENDKW